MHRIRIEMAEHGRGRVFVDETEIGGVHEIKFETTAGGKNTVRLALYAREVVITGPSEIVRDFLIVHKAM